jgi:acetyltransferase-like isoleucine patch superfamily enzyme
MGVYRRFLSRLGHLWFSQVLYRREGTRLRHLEIGRGTRFAVPVRSGGRGTLVIGTENSFGFILGPRQGNGEVLLQPRNPSSVIAIGMGNEIGNNVSIIAKQRITIGNSCLIGDQVMIYDSDFHNVDPRMRRNADPPTAEVRIEDNVWIGSRAMVLKGVTIGRNTVIGAMSLVIRSVPSDCVAAGVPARVIRHI